MNNIIDEETEIESTVRKLHRAEKSLEFIQSCQFHKITPSFAQLSISKM